MKLYLIAKTEMTDGMSQFLQDKSLTWNSTNAASDAEKLVEAAGRICYMSFGQRQFRQSTAEYLSNIIGQGHGSVLEHANFTLLVDGITRALSHQLVRHRAGFAYSQLSQQYHDESDADFLEPLGQNLNADLKQRWKKWHQETQSLYKDLLQSESKDYRKNNDKLSPKERLRLARSRARLVLPNATATSIVITGNARAWRNVLSTRGDIEGDIEMRIYCVAAYRILYESAPSLFSGFEVMQDALGEYIRSASV